MWALAEPDRYADSRANTVERMLAAGETAVTIRHDVWAETTGELVGVATDAGRRTEEFPGGAVRPCRVIVLRTAAGLRFIPFPEVDEIRTATPEEVANPLRRVRVRARQYVGKEGL